MNNPLEVVHPLALAKISDGRLFLWNSNPRRANYAHRNGCNELTLYTVNKVTQDINMNLLTQIKHNNSGIHS